MLSFYRDIAFKDGGTPSPEDDGEGVYCFTKSVDAKDVELSVGFLGAAGEKHGDDYDMDVNSSTDGGAGVDLLEFCMGVLGFSDIVAPVFRVLLVFVAMTALLLGTSAAEADRFPKILAAPVSPWPEGGQFFIHLCIKGGISDACGGKETTPVQRRAIEQRLRQMPQILDLHYKSKQEALAKMLADAPGLTGVIEENDVPEAFTGRLHRWSDAPAFDSAIKALPGIHIARVIPTPFWEGKADIAVILCDNSRRPGYCEERARATAGERKAIEDLLKRMKGVKRIYFADQAHNMWMSKKFDTLLSRAVNPDPQGKDDDAKPKPLDEYYESYYVKLDDQALVPSIVDKVNSLPGVAGGGKVSVFYGLGL
ncbi:permease-like cell division protein FtsX [Streptosporangium sp. NPDC049644]|uniref:permease-like cell division protein FtsX n=1 Tax=Streptosporangium sp. NPDC049644 TaxID=3155507 RepID=UPI003445918A